MKKILLTAGFLCVTLTAWADMPFLSIIAGGIAIANGVYLSDTSQELHQKSAAYHYEAVDLQKQSEDAARLSGAYEAYIEIAQLFNDMRLLSEATQESLKYEQLAISLQQQSEAMFNESKSRETKASQYTWYAGASYAAGGILLVKGIWDLCKESRIGRLTKKQEKSWQISTAIMPGRTNILLAKKF